MSNKGGRVSPDYLADIAPEYAGIVSRVQAERKAEKEYEQFNRVQKIESDFDRIVKKMK